MYLNNCESIGVLIKKQNKVTISVKFNYFEYNLYRLIVLNCFYNV